MTSFITQSPHWEKLKVLLISSGGEDSGQQKMSSWLCQLQQPLGKQMVTLGTIST